ncbi:MAG: 6-bladed beta-propeller [Dysgonamonadaceae bacterium]|jgi:hypothetical protein|nr:6-bladed beta-propeller [Dysgonamonadaceae bacterium]
MKPILILFCFCFLLACTNKNADTNNVDPFYVGELKFEQQPLLLSEFVDSIEFISLEFNENCMLREDEIKKVVCHKDHIFIIESQHSQCVYHFDKNGNFVNQIGRHGKGPDETVKLKDFSLDEENEIIYLLDDGKQKIMGYNFDGKMVADIKISQFASDFEYQRGLFYIFCESVFGTTDNYKLKIRDKKGELLKCFFPVERDYSIGFSNKTFTKTNKGLYFINIFEYNIYYIENKDMERQYTFDFGTWAFTKEEVDDILNAKIRIFDLLINKERLSTMNNLQVWGKWIYFTKIRQRLQYSFLYNTETKALKYGQLFDDIEHTFSCDRFLGQTGNMWTGIFNPESISGRLNYYHTLVDDKKISPEKEKELTDRLNAHLRGDYITEMNPWLVFYHIKD